MTTVWHLELLTFYLKIKVPIFLRGSIKRIFKMKVSLLYYFCTKIWFKKMKTGDIISQSCVFQELEGQIVKKNIYISS